MKKIISAISAAALAASAAVYTPAGVSAETTGDTVKIMCIGDSITDGYGVSGSYRKFIYHNLTELGYSIDMVGAKGGGWTPVYTDEETGESFEYDDENTGYSGYAIKEYSGRSGILETLQSTGCLSTEPDIVTLQIGTNDVIDCHELDNAGNRLETLITYIMANIPEGSVLFVTTIPDLDPNRSDVYSWFGNYRHSADWQTQYSDDEVEVNVQTAVDTYNSTVRSTVAKLQGTYSNLYAADVHSAITDVTTQLGDGVHPNNTGYKAMGAYWSGVLDNYLKNEPDIQPVTTETTVSTANTTTFTATTTTTTAVTTETTSETTTYEQTTSETTTTVTAEDDSRIRVSDLVLLSRYLLADSGCDYTSDRLALYDIDGDGRLSVYDLVLMRKVVIWDNEKEIIVVGVIS